MTATVVISVEVCSRAERACAWLEARPRALEVLIVAANLEAASQLARDLARKKGAGFGWHRLTLAQLAATMALPALADRGLASISQLGTEATVARLVHRLKSEARLGRFDVIGDTPGLPRAITSVIAELQLARLSPDRVASVAADVAPLLDAYEAELAEISLTDWSGVLALAADHASSHRLSGLPVLMLDVPMRNEAELAFVEALASAAPELLATVPSADEPTLTRLRDRIRSQSGLSTATPAPT